jgi:hypothetical protein
MRALRSAVVPLVVVAAVVALVAAGWASGRDVGDPTGPDLAASLADHLDGLTSAPLELSVTTEVEADEETVAALERPPAGPLRAGDLTRDRTVTLTQAGDGGWRLSVRDDRFTWLDLRGAGGRQLEMGAAGDDRGGPTAQGPLLLARFNALRLLHVADGRLDRATLAAVADAVGPDGGAALVAALANERWVAVTGATPSDLGPAATSGAARLLALAAAPGRLTVAVRDLGEARRVGDEVHASGLLVVSAGASDDRTATATLPVDVVAAHDGGAATGPVELVGDLGALRVDGEAPSWLRSALAPFAAQGVPVGVRVLVAPSTFVTATDVTPAATVELERVAALLEVVERVAPVSVGGR